MAAGFAFGIVEAAVHALHARLCDQLVLAQRALRREYGVPVRDEAADVEGQQATHFGPSIRCDLT
jgi:hypothetical protein